VGFHAHGVGPYVVELIVIAALALLLARPIELVHRL
jgi:hypothetical protein